jgi:hypothetical protein
MVKKSLNKHGDTIRLQRMTKKGICKAKLSMRQTTSQIKNLYKTHIHFKRAAWS